MRIFHVSDLHLGSTAVNTISRITGRNITIQDSLDSLDMIIQKAIETDSDGNSYCDLLVITGDTFHKKNPSPTIQSLFAERLRTLIERGIQVVILLGNHDLPIGDLLRNPLDQYDKLQIANCYIISKPGLKTIQTRRGDIQVLGIPWISHRKFIKSEIDRPLSEKEWQESLIEHYRSLMKQFLKEADESKPLLFAGHLSVLGAIKGSEKDLSFASEPFFDAKQLADQRLWYGALGHFHKHQAVHENPPLVYAGSVQRTDFCEEMEEKGYVEVEFDPSNQKTSWRFSSLPARNYKTVSIQLPVKEAASDVLTDFIREKIQSVEITDCIIRVTINGEPDQIKIIDEKAIKALLTEAYYIYEIRYETSTDLTRLRAPGLSRESPIDEVIRMYLTTRSFDTERQQELYDFTRAFIQDQVKNGKFDL